MVVLDLALVDTLKVGMGTSGQAAQLSLCIYIGREKYRTHNRYNVVDTMLLRWRRPALGLNAALHVGA